MVKVKRVLRSGPDLGIGSIKSRAKRNASYGVHTTRY